MPVLGGGEPPAFLPDSTPVPAVFTGEDLGVEGTGGDDRAAAVEPTICRAGCVRLNGLPCAGDRLLSSEDGRSRGGLARRRAVFRLTGVFSDSRPKLVASETVVSNGSTLDGEGGVQFVPKDLEVSQFSV